MPGNKTRHSSAAQTLRTRNPKSGVDDSGIKYWGGPVGSRWSLGVPETRSHRPGPPKKLTTDLAELWSADEQPLLGPDVQRGSLASQARRKRADLLICSGNTSGRVLHPPPTFPLPAMSGAPPPGDETYLEKDCDQGARCRLKGRPEKSNGRAELGFWWCPTLPDRSRSLRSRSGRPTCSATGTSTTAADEDGPPVKGV